MFTWFLRLMLPLSIAWDFIGVLTFFDASALLLGLVDFNMEAIIAILPVLANLTYILSERQVNFLAVHNDSF